jgi:hypothetical protein
MTEEARREWLLVAWETLKHLPADLLAMGCRKARETADHPSKIVPAILADTRDMLERRRNHVHESAPVRQLPAPRPQPVPPEVTAAIKAEFGLGTSEVSETRHIGTPKMPTRADYIALGVDPANLPGHH